MRKNTFRYDSFMIYRIVILLSISLLFTTHAMAATSLTQNSITWNFDTDYTTGQFVNGDYYVVDPGVGVTIESISPASTSGANTENGSMINPIPGAHGYDEDAPYNSYSDALNVALDVDSGNPLVLSAGDSLVSSISASPTCGPSGHAYLADMAVLSVVYSAPASGSFRPPYAGADKPIHNISEIDYSVLQSVTSASGAPSLSTLENYFSRVWYDNNNSWGNRVLHPCNNMPDYGADMAGNISQALLALHTDYTNTQKQTLLYSMLQYAIDLSAIVANGGIWEPNGGHALGRKSVLALGAMVLDDSTMKSQLNAETHFIFGEDGHTFYISEDDWYPARTVCGYNNGSPPCTTFYSDRQYNSTDHPVGMAEWGRNHSVVPYIDNSQLNASYRDYYGRQLGGLLSSLMLGAESLWNWGPAFDYIERIKPEMESPCNLGGGGNCYYNASEWELDMYDMYWNTYRGYTQSTGPRIPHSVTSKLKYDAASHRKYSE